MRKTKKTNDRIYFWIAIILLIITLIVIVMGSNSQQFYGAYLSTKSDCFPQITQAPEGYVQAGQLETFANGEQKITIFINDTRVIRHELCHYTQNINGKSYSCKNLIGVYANELECYFLQNDNSSLTQQEIDLLEQLS